MTVYIYVLCDPCTCKIRYIGRTSTSLSKRLREHISKSKNYMKYNPKGKLPHKEQWIINLLKRNIKPQIRLIATVNGWKKSYDFEKSIIFKYKDKYKLTNAADRGPGCTKYKRVISEATIVKIKQFYSKEENKINFYNKLYCYDVNGNYIKEFKSVKFASEELNIPSLHITNMINFYDNKRGKRNPIYNYYFSKFKYDVLDLPFSKKHDRYLKVITINKKTNEKLEFVNLKKFGEYYSLNQWDLLNIHNKITNRVLTLCLDYDIYIENNLIAV